MTTDYCATNTEPRLAEVLEDPIVRLLMSRDRVTATDLSLLIEMIRMHLMARGLWRAQA